MEEVQSAVNFVVHIIRVNPEGNIRTRKLKKFGRELRENIKRNWAVHNNWGTELKRALVISNNGKVDPLLVRSAEEVGIKQKSLEKSIISNLTVTLYDSEVVCSVGLNGTQDQRIYARPNGLSGPWTCKKRCCRKYYKVGN